MERKTLYDEYLKDEEFARLMEQENLIMEVTEGFCRILQEEGLSRTKLANSMGKTRGYISLLLNGRRNITLRSLSDIAYFLGYSVRIFFTKRISKSTQIPMSLEWDVAHKEVFPLEQVDLADDYIYSAPKVARLGG